MHLNRRDFLKNLSFATAGGALSGCSVLRPSTPNPDFMWGYLVHFGMNSWADVKLDRWGTKTGLAAETHSYADYLRFEREQWDFVTERMAAVGMNTIVIDLAEGVQFESHPELAVRGSWSQDDFRRELDRLRALGLEPIPKLNFSAGHDSWLKDYHRMVSTSKYYEVCSDLIRETAELFGHPRYIHLGYDEENYPNQSQYDFVVVRQGELWWHDFLWFVKTTESAGMRPWIWSDYYHSHEEEFLRRMPKSVIQSNWYYGNDFNPEKSRAAKTYLAFEKAGFDQIPCGSNWASDLNFGKTVEFAKNNLPQPRLKGFLMAPWTRTLNVFRAKDSAAIDQVAAAMKAFHG